jgi:hypothetical protein
MKMKKYIAPIIGIFIDIALHAYSPDSVGLRIFLQGFVYACLFRILVLKTDDEKVTNTLLKWTLGVGIVLPVILIKTELLIIDQIYIADIIILVPILFHELMKEDNGERKSIDIHDNLKVTDKDGDSD